MDLPGIEVRPIIDMTGTWSFNEVFFNDVRLPASCLVGELDDGWRLAKLTLGNERVSLSTGGVLWGRGPTALDVIAAARAAGPIRDMTMRQRIAAIYIDHTVLELIRRRTDGGPPRRRAARAGGERSQAARRCPRSARDGARPRPRRRGGDAHRRRRRCRRGPRRMAQRVPVLPGADDRRRDRRSATQHHRRAGPRPAQVAPDKHCPRRQAGVTTGSMGQVLERDVEARPPRAALSPTRRVVTVASCSSAARPESARRRLSSCWRRRLIRRRRVAFGRCDALGTPRALGPFVDIADSLGIADADDRDGLLGQLLAAIRPGPPTMLVVEDAHWADAATIELLAMLGRRAVDLPLLLVVTYREDEVDAGHPLRLALGNLATASGAVWVGVGPLSIDAVRVLAAPTGADADAVYALTAGNPFYVTEALAAPDSDRCRRASASPSWPGRRACPAQARDVLDAVAIVPGRAETLAARRPRASPPREHVDECLAAGVLLGARRRPRLSTRACSPSDRARDRCRTSRASYTAGRLRRSRHGRAPIPARLAHHAERAGDDATLARAAGGRLPARGGQGRQPPSRRSRRARLDGGRTPGAGRGRRVEAAPVARPAGGRPRRRGDRPGRGRGRALAGGRRHAARGGRPQRPVLDVPDARSNFRVHGCGDARRRDPRATPAWPRAGGRLPVALVGPHAGPQPRRRCGVG